MYRESKRQLARFIISYLKTYCAADLHADQKLIPEEEIKTGRRGIRCEKLLEQILKFGVVGVVCFVIDFVITMVMSTVLREIFSMGTSRAALVAAFFGFVISVIVNYLLSMKYVFVRKEDMDRRKEFIIFCDLKRFRSRAQRGHHQGVSGCDLCKLAVAAKLCGPTLATAGEIVATAVVMVYNFVTRKIFLEQKDA